MLRFCENYVFTHEGNEIQCGLACVSGRFCEQCTEQMEAESDDPVQHDGQTFARLTAMVEEAESRV